MHYLLKIIHSFIQQRKHYLLCEFQLVIDISNINSFEISREKMIFHQSEEENNALKFNNHYHHLKHVIMLADQNSK
jgi:hypothetical protein